MSSLVDQLKLSKDVRDQAREIAEIVGDARTLGGRCVNDVLQVVRDRARAWVRGAYLTGYQDEHEVRKAARQQPAEPNRKETPI